MPKTSFRALACLVSLLLAVSAWGADAKKLADPAALNEQAPPKYSVKFETTKGTFVIDVTRDWAPQGADRFYNLVKNGYYDDMRFFRVVPNFVVQFGISGDPNVNKVWQTAKIKDDPVKQSNKGGSITFATAGPNTRTTQVFINLKDNARLDEMGFAPFGVVSQGMDVVNQLFSGYGDTITSQQGQIQAEGNAFLDAKYEKLDKLLKATIVGSNTAEAPKKADKAETPATK